MAKKHKRKMTKKIMIVDDEKDIHQLYEMMFKGEDYNLIHSFDGDDAMQMLEDDKPDLIILDITMDMVTGDTFFLHLKGFQEFSDIPVIIISSAQQKKFKNLKKIEPNLVYLNKADLTKESLLEEIDKKFKKI